MSSDGPGQREVAYRLFATEYDDADYSYSESDEERAPKYVVTPTGARVNRLFVVGVLTEVEQVGDDVLRGRVADPTGAFVLYAGQYQPDEQAVLERTDPPEFVAVTGKARTFQPDDAERVYTSIRPESINRVDAETRDRWTVQAARQTLERVEIASLALESGLSGEELRVDLTQRGVDPARAEGIARALDHYGTTATYLDAVRRMAVDAARFVADEVDEVQAVSVAPDEAGETTVSTLRASLPALADLTAAGEGTDSALRTEQPATDGEPGDVSQSDTDVEMDGISQPDTGEETAETTDDAGPADPAPSVDSTPSDNGADTATDDPTEPAQSETADPPEFDDDEFDPGEYDIDEETREEVEAEFGTDFTSGAEVDEPGSADIDHPEPEPVDTDQSDSRVTDSEPADVTPDGDEADDEAATAGDNSSRPASGDRSPANESVEDTTPTTTEPASDSGDDLMATDDETDSTDTDTLDPIEAVLSVMSDLDEGSGADRSAVVSTATDRHDLSVDAVEGAIQEALMEGKCYEPDESSLKPI